MHTTHKRISAAVLSLALGFSTVGAVTFAPIAGAQITANQASSVNTSEDVSLTIEKFIGLPIEDPAINLPPGDEFEFTVEKLSGINLQTTAGWEEVAGIIAGTITPDIDQAFETVTLSTTDGKATISTATNTDFTVGVYRVTEIASPGYTVAAPFYVTLPFTDPTSGAWNYDQTVRPKNQEDILIEKDVDDLGVTIGEEITYTISAPLPAGNLTELSVVDDLPAQLEAVDPATVKVYTGADAATRTELIRDDSTIVANGGDGNQLTVTFGPTDRTTLQGRRAVNATLKIFVEFDTTVTSLPDDGIIENHASIDFGGGLRYSTDPDGPGEPGTGTETRLGQLTISKVDEADQLISAGSASFELWRCQSDGATPAKYTVLDTALPAATSADGTGKTTSFTTVNGQATLYGVQVINWVNGEPVPTNAIFGEDLCVVETAAPAGYLINPEPQPVEFDLTTTDEFDMVVDVVNLEDSITGQLPATGGGGTLAMIAAGVLVAIAGGFAALRGNRGGTRARR